MCVRACACVCVYPPPKVVKTSSMIRHDMNHILLVTQVLQLSMATIVGIISRHGLRIEVHHRNRPNKSDLALCKTLLSL